MSGGRARKSKAHRREITARKRASGRGTTCPTPQKLSYPSKDAADTFLRYAGYQGRSVRPHRSYPCPCGQWHTSSKEN